MWIGVPKDASVCLRCRLRIERLLLSRTLPRLRPQWQNARARSTAAAVVEDVAEDVAEDVEEMRKERRPSKKHKKYLRRVWQPPRVAELGVSSLGKPAEVLVLKDRDRHVPVIANDGNAQNKASEPRILEALQAETLPLSSDTVKQILDQIGDPYRKGSKALSIKERAGLRKKLMDGFTQDQLRFYCMGSNGPDLVSSARLEASDGKTKPQTNRAFAQTKQIGKDAVAAKKRPRMRKGYLVDYILKHTWSLSSLGTELIEQHIPVTTHQIEHMLNRKQLSLEQYAKHYSIVIDSSRGDGNISISGQLKHVHAAQGDIKQFCKGTTLSRVRSTTTGRSLKKSVNADLVDHLSRTYNVVVEWASKQDKDIPKDEDYLTICHHKTQDPRDALNAERAFLLAERDSCSEDERHKQKVTMWSSPSQLKPCFVPHQAPGASNHLDRQKAWARWVIPQRPLHIGYTNIQSGVRLDHMQQYLASLNKQITLICKLLKGGNDEFFLSMPLKQRADIRRRLNTNKIKEEIFADFGKILFPSDKVRLADAFDYMYQGPKIHLLTAKDFRPAFLSSDIPAIPNFLRSLSPFDDTEGTIDGADTKKYRRYYRLRYVPVASQLPSGSKSLPLEIDVLAKGKPGNVVTDHVRNAWSILEEQSHKLLTPLFAFDIEFVRQLKNHVFQAAGKDSQSGKLAWVKELEKQIQRSVSDRFPPFLQVALPDYTLDEAVPRDENPQDILEEDASSQIEPVAADTAAIKIQPRKLDYMLESWEQVYSTTYKAKRLCLEHLSFEGMTSDETRESMRLAPQPLLESNIKQTVINVLVERAIKLAAYMSDPRLLDLRGEPALSTTKNHKEEESGKVLSNSNGNPVYEDDSVDFI